MQMFLENHITHVRKKDRHRISNSIRDILLRRQSWVQQKLKKNDVVEKHLHNQIHPVTNSRKIWEKRWNEIQGLEKLITKTSRKFLISQGLFQPDHHVCV